MRYLCASVRQSALAFALWLAAGGGALAVDTGLGSQEDQQNLVAGICMSQIPMGDAGCKCLAERSLRELNDEQRGYLILSVVQPPAAERLPIAKSQEQLALIFTFLETASNECAPAAAPAEGAAPETPPADPQ